MAEAAELLAVDSYYLEVNQFDPNFGKLASRLALESIRETALLSRGHDWASLKHALAGPTSVLKSLTVACPALAWWRDTQHLTHDSSPVSLNLADAVRSDGSDYDNHSVSGAKQAFKNELLRRYARHESVKNYFHSWFDDTFIEAEPVMVESLETVGLV